MIIESFEFNNFRVNQIGDFENGIAPGVVQGADWLVHGSVDLGRDSLGNIRIVPETYDFQPHGSFFDSPVRNSETFGGFLFGSGAGVFVGTDFLINYSGWPHVTR